MIQKYDEEGRTTNEKGKTCRAVDSTEPPYALQLRLPPRLIGTPSPVTFKHAHAEV